MPASSKQLIQDRNLVQDLHESNQRWLENSEAIWRANPNAQNLAVVESWERAVKNSRLKLDAAEDALDAAAAASLAA